MNGRTGLFFAILLAFASPSAAKELFYILPQDAASVSMLPDPPADGSPAQQAELAALHAIEAARSEAQAEAARADSDDKSIFVFRAVFGPSFTRESLPLTAALGERIDGDSSANGRVAKKIFHRLHPYTFDQSLHTACKPHHAPEADAYPSGHALRGWLLGLTLAEMVPEKRQEIFVRAADYAHNRLVCGMHYPSDVEASKPLAYAIHALMTRSPAYRRDLTAARAELRKAINLPD